MLDRLRRWLHPPLPLVRDDRDIDLYSRKSVVVATPTMGTVSARWAVGYASIEFPMNSFNPRIVKQRWPVDLARNSMVAESLDLPSRPTHIAFLDDDVLAHPTWIKQLLHAEKDIVTGVYYGKEEVSEPILFGPPGEGVMVFVPGSGLHRIYGCGMGLCLIRTEVFRRMRDKLDLGLDSRGNPKWFYTGGDRPEEKARFTEDLYFLPLARRAGFEVWADTHPRAFAFHEDRVTGQGYPQAQWKQYLETGTFSFPVPENLRGMIQPELIGAAG